MPVDYQPATRMTPELPGIGGILKECPEDFFVDEVAETEPSGTGQHLWVRLEKRDLSADKLLQRVASALQISSSDIGTAGLKDTRAVTRQTISVPVECEARLQALEGAEIRILDARPHDTKLRTGRLKGNQFSVLVRDVVPDALARATAIAAALKQTGVANYYGMQRFGVDGATAEMGFSLLQGDAGAALGGAAGGRRRFLKRLAISAAQSALFNVYLNRRVVDGQFHRVVHGDLLLDCRAGYLLWAHDLDKDQRRYDERRCIPTGPMFGCKMRQPKHDAQAWEQSVLGHVGISADGFDAFARLAPGTRRPILVSLNDLYFEKTPDGLQLAFFLPAGSYATVVLDEFRKAGNGVK